MNDSKIFAKYYSRSRSNFLAHHGVKGQKWGVKNGPPYPLHKFGSGDKLNENTPSNSNHHSARKPKFNVKVIAEKLNLSYGDPISPDESCKLANPGYIKDKYRSDNCGKAVIADILIEDGLHCKSKELSDVQKEKHGMSWSEVLKPFNDASVDDYIVKKSDATTATSCKNSVSNRLLEYSNNEDSVGIAKFAMGPTNSHYVKYRVNDGEVTYYNSQTGVSNCDKYFKGMSNGQVLRKVEFSRLDGREIDYEALEDDIEG